MFRKLVALALSFALLFVLAGCSQGNSDGPDYADDEVIAAIAKGLESRWDVADAYKASGQSQTNDEFAEAVQAEINVISSFKDRQFEDTDLQETVLAYINVLNKSYELTQQYSIDSDEFYEGWQSAYDERLALLKTLVDDYGLAVKDKYQSELDDLILEGNAVVEKNEEKEKVDKLVSSIKFKQKSSGYGFYTYTATVENTTDLDFEDFSLTLSLYDEDDVMAQETYASVSSWKSGEKVKFEAMSEIDASKVKVTADFYEVAK